MKKTLIPFIAAVVSLSACREQVKEYDNSLPAVPPVSTVVLPVADSAGISLPQEQPNANTQPVNTVALNPEHGMPRHRCDIAVGAPLNSPSQSIQKSAPAPAISQPANLGGAVTVNPPHGQPGHDCAIPVGQPLKG